MLHSYRTSLRRAKPILGTIVDIALYSKDTEESLLLQLSSRAFSIVHRIHQQMSFFNKDSEIAKLNNAKSGVKVPISRDTLGVLRFSVEMHDHSKGCFDVIHRSRDKYPSAALIFCDDDTVIKTHPLVIDLGGVAKGYAVDEAAKVFADHPQVSGVVNAGGDMRVFGGEEFPVTIRSPRHDGTYFYGGDYRDCSIATSIICRPQEEVSITIKAQSCMVADALTKSLLELNPQQRSTLVSRYHASIEALVSNRDVFSKELTQ